MISKLFRFFIYILNLYTVTKLEKMSRRKYILNSILHDFETISIFLYILNSYTVTKSEKCHEENIF